MKNVLLLGLFISVIISLHSTAQVDSIAGKSKAYNMLSIKKPIQEKIKEVDSKNINQHLVITENDNSKAVEIKKYWKEYLFEFLMVFLAVLLGFFADNKREENKEDKRELQLIKSMIADLYEDARKLKVFIINCKSREPSFDIVLKDFDSFKSGIYLKTYYSHLNFVCDHYVNFEPTDGTILQLKNAGSMIVISRRNQAVANRIMNYDLETRKLLLQQSLALERMKQIMDLKFSLIDKRKIDLLNSEIKADLITEESPITVLIAKNEQVLGSLYYQISNYRVVLRATSDLARSLEISSFALIAFLTDKYRISRL